MRVSSSFVIVLAISLGAVQGVNWQTGNWAFACDFKGGDIGNVQVSGAGFESTFI